MPFCCRFFSCKGLNGLDVAQIRMKMMMKAFHGKKREVFYPAIFLEVELAKKAAIDVLTGAILFFKGDVVMWKKTHEFQYAVRKILHNISKVNIQLNCH